MKTNKKKIFSILISTILLVAMSTTAVFACGPTKKSTGYNCGPTKKSTGYTCGPTEKSTDVSDSQTGGSIGFETPTDGNGGWTRVTPCNKLSWVYDGSQMSVVVAKKGHDYVVWSYEALKGAEKQAIYNSFKNHVNGMNGAKFANVTFISGDGASYGGVTIHKDTIDFAHHCTWSMYAMGLCTIYTEYDVRYVDRTTGKDLAAPKTVEDQKVGATVQEEAITIDKYDLDDISSKNLTLQREGNEIIFYYKPAVANFTVRYVDISSGEYVDIIDPEVGTAEVGSKLNRTSKVFDGYIYNETSTRKSVTITRNDDENVIIFEYIHFE